MEKMHYFRWSVKFQLAVFVAIMLLFSLLLPPISDYLRMRKLENFWLGAGGCISKQQRDGVEGNALFGLSRTFDCKKLYEMERIPNLTHLYLRNSNVDDQILRAIYELDLPELVYLQLGETDITDQGLDGISKLSQLEHLVLHDTSISDIATDELARLQKLQVLDLRRTNVSLEGFERLQIALPKTKIFLKERPVLGSDD